MMMDKDHKRKSWRWKNTVKADAAQRRVKEHQDRAAERGTKRTKSSPEERQADAPTTKTTTTQVSTQAFPFLCVTFPVKTSCGRLRVLHTLVPRSGEESDVIVHT